MNVPANYAEARAAADAARDRANKIKARIERDVYVAIQQRTHMGKHYATQHIDDVVRKLCREDPLWNSAVKVNQWMIEYATMYAQGEMIARLDGIIATLRATNGRNLPTVVSS